MGIKTHQETTLVRPIPLHNIDRAIKTKLVCVYYRLVFYHRFSNSKQIGLPIDWQKYLDIRTKIFSLECCPVLDKTYIGEKCDFEIWAFQFFSLDKKSTP